MRRRSSILSLPGFIILVILLTGLGLTIWRQGGLAFSPGSLSANGRLDVELGGFSAHAEFERQCALCHQPITKLQGDLCVVCHKSIADQIVSQSNFHGNLVNRQQCADCHSDHRGRDFDLRLGHLENFDHSGLAFSLIWHQVDYAMEPLVCLDCHTSNDEFSASTRSCTSCHAGNDIQFMTDHLQDFGSGCTSCHDGQDSMARFNHENTAFPLVKSHLEIRCVDCHTQGQFGDMSRECVTCHVEPAAHMGAFTLDCGSCHDSQSWKPALLEGQPFDHYSQVSFNLAKHGKDYSGAPITCLSCHPNSLQEFTPQTCIECHAVDDLKFIDQHQLQFGVNCLDCHDGVDRMQGFEHAEYFPLDGRHVEIDCQACHVGQVYNGTPQECIGCHLEPHIHEGYFGFKCEYCHSTTSWYPAQLQSHKFPIDHGDQGAVECQVCHDSTYSQYSCYGCHEHQQAEIVEEHQDEGISGGELIACFQCHEDGSDE
jgi:hypothetical protein